MNRSKFSYLLVILLSVSALQQCKSMFSAAFTPPKVAVEKVHFQDVDIAGVSLLLDIVIDNPNAIGVTLNRLEYNLDIDGERLVTGTKADKIEINGRKRNSFSLPIKVGYAGLKKGIAGVLSAATLPFKFTGAVHLDTPVGNMAFDINKEGAIPIPKRPNFEIAKVAIDEMGITSATIRFDVKISNNEDIKLDIRGCDYFVEINGQNVSSSSVNIGRKLEKNRDLKLGIPVNIKLMGLKRSLLDVIKSGKFRYLFKLNLAMDSGYGPYNLKYEKDALVSLY